jgi:hypothetical protein
VRHSIPRGQRFTTLGKQAKAIGAGIKAQQNSSVLKATSWIIKVKLQTNASKGITLDVSRHKTTTDRTALLSTPQHQCG